MTRIREEEDCPKGIQLSSIPELRWHLFCKCMAESEKLPPTLGALRQHILRVEYGARLQFPSRNCWTPCRMATTATATTDSSSQPPLMSHQHLRPSWRWSGVSARETANRIAVHASPRTCHARTYVFATHSANITLTRITTIANQMTTVTVNVLYSTTNLII